MIAPARTGKERSRSTAVISTDQTKRGMASKVKEEERIFKMVVIKLMAPKIEDTPARCNLKMAKSTEIPE